MSAEGFSVVEEGGYRVALDTRLTPEIVEEGLARELVRRLNEMRKEAGFRVEDRIVTFYEGEEVVGVFERYGEYVRGETLSVRVERGVGGEGVYGGEVSVDGVRVRLGVMKV